MYTRSQADAPPSDAESYSTLQPVPHSPVKTRGSGRRGRYKIPLTVPSLPRFDHSPEEVARYTIAAFVPFFVSVSPDATSPQSAPDSSSLSIQEDGRHATDLEIINRLDDFQFVDSHVVSGEQASSAVLSVATSIQELDGGVTDSDSPTVSNVPEGSASLSRTPSIHGAAAHQDTGYYAPDLQLHPQTGLPDVSRKSVSPIQSGAGDQAFVTSQVVHATVNLISPVLGLGGDFTGPPLPDVDGLQWPGALRSSGSQQTVDGSLHDLELVGIQSAPQFNDDCGSTGCVAAGNEVSTENFDQCPAIEGGAEEHSDPVNYLESLWNLSNKIKAKKNEPVVF